MHVGGMGYQMSQESREAMRSDLDKAESWNRLTEFCLRYLQAHKDASDRDFVADTCLQVLERESSVLATASRPKLWSQVDTFFAYEQGVQNDPLSPPELARRKAVCFTLQQQVVTRLTFAPGWTRVERQHGQVVGSQLLMSLSVLAQQEESLQPGHPSSLLPPAARARWEQAAASRELRSQSSDSMQVFTPQEPLAQRSVVYGSSSDVLRAAPVLHQDGTEAQCVARTPVGISPSGELSVQPEEPVEISNATPEPVCPPPEAPAQQPVVYGAPSEVLRPAPALHQDGTAAQFFACTTVSVPPSGDLSLQPGERERILKRAETAYHASLGLAAPITPDEQAELERDPLKVIFVKTGRIEAKDLEDRKALALLCARAHQCLAQTATDVTYSIGNYKISLVSGPRFRSLTLSPAQLQLHSPSVTIASHQVTMKGKPAFCYRLVKEFEGARGALERQSSTA